MEYSFVYDPDYLERIIEINNKKRLLEGYNYKSQNFMAK